MSSLVTPARPPLSWWSSTAPGDVVVVVVAGRRGGAGRRCACVVVVVDDVDVVVDVLDVVVVEWSGVGVVVAGAGDGLKRFFTAVPASAPPKMLDSGLPEISSMAVMKSSASTNTVTAAGSDGAPRESAGRRPARARIGLVVALQALCRRGIGRRRDLQRSVSPTGAAVDVISRRLRSSRPRPLPLVPTTSSTMPTSPADTGTAELAQQRGRLGRLDHHLLDGLVAPLDRLCHQGGAHGGGRRADGHADDRALDPEGRRDDRPR